MITSNWIPTKERLPKHDGSFWVTSKDGTVHLGYMKPDLSDFRRKGVIAWMPYPTTPAPYKESK